LGIHLALEKLEGGTLDKLLEPQNKIKFADQMNNHIVKGKVDFDTLKNSGKLTNANGRELLITEGGGMISIDETAITVRFANLSNGVVLLAEIFYPVMLFYNIC
jgi:uncharacterized surface protein with fasciclin (FAS1) repeats